MSDGVLYKFNATAASESQAKKFNASAVSDGQVRHANATTWFDNYPMEKVYSQYFNVVWTQAYNGSGVKLDATTWGDHPRSGDSVGFIGLFGFDRTAMQNFVADGVIQKLQIEVRFDDPSHAGNPVVDFFPHVYTSKPSSYSGVNANKNYKAQSTFNQTGADYSRWITLPVGAWLGGQFGGVTIQAPSNTAANSARFAGKTTSHSLNSFNTRMLIEVLK